MASSAYIASRQCPLVRTNSTTPKLRRRGSISTDDRRGRTVMQLKLITPMVHGRVDAGPRTSPLEMTASTYATTQLSSVWSERYSPECDDDLYNVTPDASCNPSPYAFKTPGFSTLADPTFVKRTIDTAGLPLIVSSPLPITPHGSRRPKAFPSRMSTPSLDGSITSEELASSSCPSTPELEQYSSRESVWDPPAQLDATAYALLRRLETSPARSRDHSPSRSPSIPQTAFDEMREIAHGSTAAASSGTSMTSRRHSSSEPTSAMTVPSPTTFFGTLGPVSRQTWCVSGTPPPPSTGTAERFYKLPWRDESPERRRNLGTLITQSDINGPSAQQQQQQRPTTATTESTLSVAEMTDGVTVSSCQSSPESPVRRTKEWLYDQWAWTTSLSIVPITEVSKTLDSPNTTAQLSAPVDLPLTPPATPPSTPPTRHAAPVSARSTPSKKAVRFLESVPETGVAKFNTPQSRHRSLLLGGFESLATRADPKDAFLHGQTRVESAHITISHFPERQSSLDNALDWLGINNTVVKPAFESKASQPEDLVFKQTIASVQRERKTIDQVQPSVWELQASQHVFGPDLVSSPLSARLATQDGLSILDYGGGPSCNWGWGAALRYRNSTVFTVPLDSSGAPSSPSPAGPSNHKFVRALSAISLPFPDNHFDLISARSMHAMLRTRRPDPLHPGKDEYDLVLQEFWRVLKPGGYLDFHLMDAELYHAGSAGRDLGRDFVAKLHQQGYDPQASRYFLPRLRNAGFDDIKRAWIVLPAANVVPTWTDSGKSPALKSRPSMDTTCSSPPLGPLPETPFLGSTQAVRPMTGLIGALAWERWIMGLERAVGGNEAQMSARVGRVMEESGRSGAGWRCLVGWARK